MPLSAAGTRTEPPVSEPMAKAHRPAATATAEPLDEPPGSRWVLASHGFHGVPRGVLTPVMPSANSTVLVLPSTTQPARFSDFTKLPSGPMMSLRSINDPAVAGAPSTANRSLIATGTPISGPRSMPAASRPSIARAAASAWSAITTWKAPSFPVERRDAAEIGLGRGFRGDLALAQANRVSRQPALRQRVQRQLGHNLTPPHLTHLQDR